MVSYAGLVEAPPPRRRVGHRSVCPVLTRSRQYPPGAR
jgi:hypothetical protein